MRYLKPAILVLTAILVVAISIADYEAEGRVGSHRIGGYSSFAPFPWVFRLWLGTSGHRAE